LKKKQDARFVGFGTFSVSKRKARTGRNPRTGESIKIPARNVVKFSAGKEFKEMVN
jgi:DNA-binding protein HU-beta